MTSLKLFDLKGFSISGAALSLLNNHKVSAPLNSEMTKGRKKSFNRENMKKRYLPYVRAVLYDLFEDSFLNIGQRNFLLNA